MDTKAPKPGTLGGLNETYCREQHFVNLADRTKRDYRQCAAFLENILDTPAHRIDTPLVAAIHDKAAQKIGWRRANMLHTFLYEVFRFNIPEGQISVTFAETVIPKPRPADKARANRPWTVEELTKVLDVAPAQIRPVIALIANTGLDPSDALNLCRDKIEGGVIWALHGRVGNPSPLPITLRLQNVLDAIAKHNAITVLASTNGTPWTHNGFSTVWYRFRTKQVEAGLIPAGLTLKGLRHMVATILREAGKTPCEIADLLGQKTASMAVWYSRDGKLAQCNLKTMQTLDAKTERRTKIVKPFHKSVKF